QTAAAFAQAMAKTRSSNALSYLAQGLAAVLYKDNLPQQTRRGAAVGGFVLPFAGAGQPLQILLLLSAALEPLPCRFSTQELVELLKPPTCFGQARRVILDQLENRYRQKFADHWDFVRFAEKQKLGLDFTSPPQRPAMPVVTARK